MRTGRDSNWLTQLFEKEVFIFFEKSFTRSIRDFSKILHAFTPIDMTLQKYQILAQQ